MTEALPQENSIERFYDLSGAYTRGLEQFENGDFDGAEMTFEKTELTAIETCAGSIMHARILIAWSLCTEAATRYNSETPQVRHNMMLIVQERLCVGLDILQSTRLAVAGKAAQDLDDEIREAQMLLNSCDAEIKNFSLPKPARPHIYYN